MILQLLLAVRSSSSPPAPTHTSSINRYGVRVGKELETPHLDAVFVLYVVVVVSSIIIYNYYLLCIYRVNITRE